MKKLLFFMFSLMALSLEAVHFQSSMSVTPESNGETNKYFVEVRIEKFIEEHSCPQLIASPCIICTPGKPAQLMIESDEGNSLSIQILIPEPPKNNIQASILIKEEGKVVLSLNNIIHMND